MKNGRTFIFFTGLCAFSLPFHSISSNHTQTHVFTFDCDDVINIRQKLGWREYARYASLVAKMAANQPFKTVKLLWNWHFIKRRSKELADTMHGATNIIHILAQELQEMGHLDITPFAQEIIELFVKPKPIWHTINYIKELKRQGYTIIGATNQDYFHHICFRKRMKEQGIDIGELFDATVVAHACTYLPEQPDTVLYHEIEPTIYMPCSIEGHKPNMPFYETVKAVAQKIQPTAQYLLHTDDRHENIIGAHTVAGFKALHFKLPHGKSARRAKPHELEATFNAWKADLEKLLQ